MADSTSHFDRPKFDPAPCESDQNTTILPLTSGSDIWLPIISCPADFPLELFELAVSQLVHHPEYNSTLILRSDTLADTTAHFPDSIPTFKHIHPIRCIHRKLLPRRPGRDAPLEQFCTLYGENETNQTDTPSTLLLSPIVPPGSSLPYYHPTVSHLAFRYISSDSGPPILRIEVVLLPNTPTDLNSRLYRTCLALLDTLHRYGWGAMTNYKKKVKHDCLVPREAYQDLYLIIRDRYKHLVDEWQEVTDPLKHVYEDIGIATFLMLLWKDTFSESVTSSTTSPNSEPECPWKSWPRPPGGFLDFGCGNGLLTHVLTSEGYSGQGIDLRARTSWAHYPESTQAHLHVHASNPILSLGDAPESDPFLKSGVFIIGNHADELTPWLPVLSTLYSASGYLSIPCCPWAFDVKYEPSIATFTDPSSSFVNALNLGGNGSNSSSYSMYRIWLASLSLHCGWEVECENLRIPSTRNWAIVGRKRTPKTPEDARKVDEHARDIVSSVRERGIFKTRRPEGKAGSH